MPYTYRNSVNFSSLDNCIAVFPIGAVEIHYNKALTNWLIKAQNTG
jgi:hypothetical protein